MLLFGLEFIIIPICLICSSMIACASGLIYRNTIKMDETKDRNYALDYALYGGLILGCICIMMLIIPPMIIGYSLLDMFMII